MDTHQKAEITHLSDDELDTVIGGNVSLGSLAYLVYTAVTSAGAIGSQSSGAGAGKVTFNPF